jgi:RHS repeat-associated protein
MRANVTRYLHSYFGQAMIAIRDVSNRMTYYSTPNLLVRYTENESGYNVTQGLDIDGTGAVNLLSGKLNYLYEDISINDGFMPINVSHIYDTNFGYGYDYFDAAQGYQAGKSFKLNVQQRVMKEGSNWFYIDAVGKKNFFTNDTVPENRSLGLKLYDVGSGSAKKIYLIDGQGNSLVFDAEGFLQQTHRSPSRYGVPINSLMTSISYYPGSCRIASITNTNTTVRFNYTAVSGSSNEYLLESLSYEKAGDPSAAKIMNEYVYSSSSSTSDRLLTKVSKLLNEAADDDKHATRFVYSGVNNLLKVQNEDAGGAAVERLVYGYSSGKISKVEHYENGVPDSGKTVDFDYKAEPSYGTQTYTAQVSNTTVLSMGETLSTGDRRYVRHVSFSGNLLTADYAYENKTDGSLVPMYTNASGFDYISFIDTYANTRTLVNNTNTSIGGNVSLNYTSLGQTGTANYAVTLWVKQTTPVAWSRVEITVNGDTANRIIYYANGQVVGWQLVTVPLQAIINLNSITIQVIGWGSNIVWLKNISVEKVSAPLDMRNYNPEYNSNGDLIRAYSHNPLNSKITMTYYTYGASVGTSPKYPGLITDAYVYEAPDTTVKAVLRQNGSQYLVSRTAYTYSGNRLSGVKTYGKNGTTYTNESYTYSGGRLTSHTDTNGVHTNYVYNSDGSATATVVGTAGVGSQSTSTTNRYQTGTGLLTSTTTGTITTGFGYNSQGALSTITHNGYNISFGYDAGGDLQSVSVPGKTLVTYADTASYDRTTYGGGQTVSNNYNADGSLASITSAATPTGAYATQAAFTYTNGQLSGISNTGGVTYSYQNHFNGTALANSGISDVTSITNASTTVAVKSENADAVGNRTDTRYYIDGGLQDHYSVYRNGNGQLSTVYKHDGSIGYTYDNNHRLSNKNTYFSSTAKSYTYDYSYVTSGSVTKNQLYTAAFNINGSTKSNYRYAYYPNGNLQGIMLHNTGTWLYRYAYDAYGRLIQESNFETGKVYLYAYDIGGNIAGRIQGDIATETLEAPTTYTYDSQWKDLLISHNGQSITYNAAGNPVSYKGAAMSWQNGRQLATLTKSGVQSSYQYDYAGIRTKKTVGSVTTNYWAAGDRILMEKPSNLNYGVWYFYYESGVYGFQYEGTNYVFEKNIFGDVSRIYNMHTGAYVGGYEYDAYGNILIQTNNTVTNANPFRYRGYYYDKESGFYYLNSRYYDPGTGRFISPDDVGNSLLQFNQPGGLNLYAYCLNNPVMYTDADGKSVTVFLLALVAGAIIGGIIGGAVSYSNGERGWELVGDIAIGAVVGIAIAGLAMASGAAIYAGIWYIGGNVGTAVILGVTAKRVVAIGLLAYHFFAVIAAPLAGIRYAQVVGLGGDPYEPPKPKTQYPFPKPQIMLLQFSNGLGVSL